MPKFEVTFTHEIERQVTCVVVANSSQEAIEKAKECDWVECDEDIAPEEGVNTLNYNAKEIEE